MQLSNQNCKSSLILIWFFFQVSPFVCVDSPQIKQEKWQTFKKIVIIGCERQAHEPCHN